MERWRVIDCSQMEGSIRSERGAIEVLKDGHSPVSLPIADIAVVLIGLKVKFSTGVIHRLLADDIAVMFCDWKGEPVGGAYSWADHGRVGARASAQARLSEPRRKNAWGRIIKAKVNGQSEVLARAGDRAGSIELRSLARDVRSGDPGNIEARAARLYWNALWGSDGFRRTPGAGSALSETRNAQLDYAYTVLRGHGIRAVLGAGLTPALGIFHRGRSNNFALVDDLIEPFRPAIDSAILDLDPDAPMDLPETRAVLVKASFQKFSKDGSTIPTVFSEFAQAYGRYVEMQTPTLHVPVWQGSVNG